MSSDFSSNTPHTFPLLRLIRGFRNKIIDYPLDDRYAHIVESDQKFS